MTATAIIQARMGSTRLPGKVLAELAGASVLGNVVARLRRARTIDRIVVATTTLAADAPIVDEAGRLGVLVTRGDADDVLARYDLAAREHGGAVIVRVTADCPLLDPEVVDRVVDALTPDVDYASNTHVRSFPRGLDVEALFADTLQRIVRMAQTPAAREHVTAFVMEQPTLFRTRQVVADEDHADLRWTIDTPADLAMARALHARFDLTCPTPYLPIARALRGCPDVLALNAHVEQKAWNHHA